jgi:hypothetical protein
MPARLSTCSSSGNNGLPATPKAATSILSDPMRWCAQTKQLPQCSLIDNKRPRRNPVGPFVLPTTNW